MTAVRPLQPGDLPAAHRLALAEHQTAYVEPVEASLADAARLPGTTPLGVFVGDTLVGFLLVRPVDGAPRRLLLWDYRIGADHQGRGHGRAGMIAALTWAREQGATHVDLATDPANDVAHGLYRSLGFVELGTLDANGERELRLQLASADPRS